MLVTTNQRLMAKLMTSGNSVSSTMLIVPSNGCKKRKNVKGR